MKLLLLEVKDMHCSNCAMKLQALEDDLPGVDTVDASYRSQKMKVVYDETIVTPAAIMDAVQKLGYTSEMVE
ncbi:MAG: heavy-metal-associated domain-containing protein [Anaerolineae bacterium]|nr:heavy-metal-associated domain-containing protein [Anaerolineae bacterium]